MAVTLALGHLNATGDHAPSAEEKVDLLRTLREQLGEEDHRLDEALVREFTALRRALEQAGGLHKQLDQLVEKLTSPPYHPAVFLAMTSTRQGEAAVVHHGNARRVVTLGEDVTATDLRRGDEVLLGPERNVILERSSLGVPAVGETAEFERATEDGRIVLRHRDERIVVAAAGTLDVDGLGHGDTVRWDRELWMAFDRVEVPLEEGLFFEETPSQTFADIGGLDSQIERLKLSLALRFEHGAVAQKYGCVQKGGVLLDGPPGNGKTLLSLACANYLATLSSSERCRYCCVNPGQLSSKWYGETEERYRHLFRIARRLGEAEPDVPALILLDEVDAIGAARGSSLTGVNDRILNALMAELDGLRSRGNVLVLAATNRLDVLDPALIRPGRLGDDIITIPRPNRDAGRAIFSKYIRSEIPVCLDRAGRDVEDPHGVLIESVLSRIYASNRQSQLATITLRDGQERRVMASDMVSGAVIAKISREALEKACVREIETGEVGLRLEDLLAATEDELLRAARMLTPRNCRSHIEDLPQDVDVVRVRPVDHQVRKAHRFLRLAEPPA